MYCMQSVGPHLWHISAVQDNQWAPTACRRNQRQRLPTIDQSGNALTRGHRDSEEIPNTVSFFCFSKFLTSSGLLLCVRLHFGWIFASLPFARFFYRLPSGLSH